MKTAISIGYLECTGYLFVGILVLRNIICLPLLLSSETKLVFIFQKQNTRLLLIMHPPPSSPEGTRCCR